MKNTLAVFENFKIRRIYDEEYAILTNIIHQEWSDLTVKGHKDVKGLVTL